MGDGLDPRNRTGNAAKRVAYENQLTRVMREVLTDETRSRLMQETDATALLRRLDAAQQNLRWPCTSTTTRLRTLEKYASGPWYELLIWLDAPRYQPGRDLNLRERKNSRAGCLSRPRFPTHARLD